jgi:hypothetical protein
VRSDFLRRHTEPQPWRTSCLFFLRQRPLRRTSRGSSRLRLSFFALFVPFYGYSRFVGMVIRAAARTVEDEYESARFQRLVAELRGTAVDEEHDQQDATVNDLAAGFGHLQD